MKTCRAENALNKQSLSSSEISLLNELFDKALRLLDNSYAPYSGVHVSSAVASSSGRIYLGVNVENASYGLTICAERSAIASMITNGERRLKAIVVVSSTPEPLPPCGACRQVIAEFGDENTLIASCSALTGRVYVWRLKELLPYAFTNRHLGLERGR